MAIFMSYCPQFEVSRAFYSNLKTRYMFESYDQKLVVFVFYDHFHELLPTVLRVPGRFACLIRTDTCLRDMTRKSSFSRFMAILMSYFPQFYGSMEIYNNLETRYMFESYDKKTRSFPVLWSFS